MSDDKPPERDQAIDQLLQSRLPRHAAPPELRARLEAQLAAPAHARRRRRRGAAGCGRR